MKGNTNTTDLRVAEIEEDIEGLKDIAFGASVDITSYTTANNKYVFPTNGYVQLSSSTNTTGIIEVNICCGSSIIVREYMKIAGSSENRAVYVRKGMSAYVQDRSSGTSVQFRGFSK